MRIVPIEAAVIPLPSEEAPRPVTNTNCAMRRASRDGLVDCIRSVRKARTDVRTARSAGSRLEDDDPGLVRLPGRSGEHEAGLRLPGAVDKPHLLGELADRIELAAIPGPESGGQDDARFDGVDELRRVERSRGVTATDGDDQDVDMAEAVDLVLGELPAQPAGSDDADVVDRDPHDRGLAGCEPDDAAPADLELTRTADLLELALARTQGGRISDPVGADDDANHSLGEAAERGLGRVDEHGHLPSAQPDARLAVIRQFHETPVCRLGCIRRFPRSAGWSSTHRCGRP